MWRRLRPAAAHDAEVELARRQPEAAHDADGAKMVQRCLNAAFELRSAVPQHEPSRGRSPLGQRLTEFDCQTSLPTTAVQLSASPVAAMMGTRQTATIGLASAAMTQPWL